MSSVTDTHMQGLMDQYSAVVSEHLPPGAPFALVDFPDHRNIGDSAIYTGELEYLDKHVGRPPSYVCTVRSYRQDLTQFCPEGTILIHGGGNFGDVWPGHQNFRLQIMKDHPDRKVVQLAQSIHFSEPKQHEDTARAISAHKDFTLLVRDKPSYEYAQAHFDCPVALCPDAAHNMWHLPPKAEPSHDVMSILRDDHEKVGEDLVPYLSTLGPIEDWPHYFWARSLTDRVIERIIAPRLPPSQILMKRRERMYRRQAWARVHRGVETLQRGQLLVSDRLHVHIMAGLMRHPHVSMDNFYGKIAKYIDAWGADGLVTQAHSTQEVRAAVEAWQSEAA